jgi:hypothetical protein
MKRLLILVPLVLCAAFLFPAGAHAQVPTYAGNGHSCSFGGPITLTGLICPLPNPTGAGNTVICVSVYGDTQNGTAGCTDDKSNTYTLACTFDDTFNHVDLSVFVAKNVTAGATQIQPVLTGNTTASIVMSAIVLEYYNIDQTTPFDAGTCLGNADSVTSVTTASTTPPATGQALLQFVFSDSSNSTGWTVGSQANITWKFLTKMYSVSGLLNGQAFQWGVYNSAAAITPTMSQASSGPGWISVSLMLKPATAGTAPPAGARVIFDTGVDLNSVVASTVVMGFAHTGNTQVMDYVSGGGTFTTTGTPTESCGNTLTQATNSPFQGTPDSNDGHVYFYTKNASACDGTLSWVFAGTNNSTSMHHYDITGADTVNPICDSSVNGRIQTAHGTQGNLNNTPVTTISITPCRINSTVIWSMGVGTGGAFSLTSPTGAALGSCVPRPFQNITECDENNGFAVFFSSSIGALTFTMQPEQAPTGIAGWDAAALAIQPPAAAGPPHQLPTMGCCELGRKAN